MTDHEHVKFAGMRRTDTTDDAICFACEGCGATYVADRCEAFNKFPTGERKPRVRCSRPARDNGHCDGHQEAT